MTPLCFQVDWGKVLGLKDGENGAGKLLAALAEAHLTRVGHFEFLEEGSKCLDASLFALRRRFKNARIASPAVRRAFAVVAAANAALLHRQADRLLEAAAAIDKAWRPDRLLFDPDPPSRPELIPCLLLEQTEAEPTDPASQRLREAAKQLLKPCYTLYKSLPGDGGQRIVGSPPSPRPLVELPSQTPRPPFRHLRLTGISGCPGSTAAASLQPSQTSPTSPVSLGSVAALLLRVYSCRRQLLAAPPGEYPPGAVPIDVVLAECEELFAGGSKVSGRSISKSFVPGQVVKREEAPEAGAIAPSARGGAAPSSKQEGALATAAEPGQDPECVAGDSRTEQGPALMPSLPADDCAGSQEAAGAASGADAVQTKEEAGGAASGSEVLSCEQKRSAEDNFKWV